LRLFFLDREPKISLQEIQIFLFFQRIRMLYLDDLQIFKMNISKPPLKKMTDIKNKKGEIF